MEESEGEVEDNSDLPTVLDDPPSVPDPPHLSDCPGTWGISFFDDMDDYGGGAVAMRDRYSGRAEGIAFADWKTRFKSWQMTQRQRNPVFNDWWAFEQLPSHLEHKALQSYDSWYEEHEDQLLVVELYWTQWVELITALKEGAAIPDARGEVVTEVDPMMMSKPPLFGCQGGEEHPGQQVALRPQGRFFHGCPRLPGRLWHHLVIHHHLNLSKSSLIIWKWSMVVSGGFACATFKTSKGRRGIHLTSCMRY